MKSHHLARWPIESKNVATCSLNLDQKVVYQNATFNIDAIVDSYRYRARALTSKEGS
ncbi:MAG: hypothetical protein PVF96_08420 [Candidatus Bathyarchaeota archaeon]